MPSTNTSEAGLETLIVDSLVSQAGYVQGRSEDYDLDHAVDLAQLQAFGTATQSDNVGALGDNELAPAKEMLDECD